MIGSAGYGIPVGTANRRAAQSAFAAMLPAIDFQHQPGFQAGEIGYELTEGLLTTEFEARDLSFAQDVPETAFRVGHLRTEFAGAAFLPVGHGGMVVALETS